MTTFFLIRHGLNDLVGKAIAGRAPGVHLNHEGKLQAQRLADILFREGLEQISSVPLERTLGNCSSPFAQNSRIDVQISKG